MAKLIYPRGFCVIDNAVRPGELIRVNGEASLMDAAEETASTNNVDKKWSLAKVAILYFSRMIGNSAKRFFEIQEANPYLGDNGIRFILDCFNYAMTGNRRMVPASWVPLLTPGPSEASSKSRKYTVTYEDRQLIDAIDTKLITLWLSRSGGVADLLLSLNVMFGTVPGGKPWGASFSTDVNISPKNAKLQTIVNTTNVDGGLESLSDIVKSIKGFFGAGPKKVIDGDFSKAYDSSLKRELIDTVKKYYLNDSWLDKATFKTEPFETNMITAVLTVNGDFKDLFKNIATVDASFTALKNGWFSKVQKLADKLTAFEQETFRKSSATKTDDEFIAVWSTAVNEINGYRDEYNKLIDSFPKTHTLSNYYLYGIDGRVAHKHENISGVLPKLQPLDKAGVKRMATLMIEAYEYKLFEVFARYPKWLCDSDHREADRLYKKDQALFQRFYSFFYHGNINDCIYTLGGSNEIVDVLVAGERWIYNSIK